MCRVKLEIINWLGIGLNTTQITIRRSWSRAYLWSSTRARFNPHKVTNNGAHAHSRVLSQTCTTYLPIVPHMIFTLLHDTEHIHMFGCYAQPHACNAIWMMELMYASPVLWPDAVRLSLSLSSSRVFAFRGDAISVYRLCEYMLYDVLLVSRELVSCRASCWAHSLWSHTLLDDIVMYDDQ